MARGAATRFVCQACGAAHAKWVGRCEACGEWDTLVEEQAGIETGAKAGRSAAQKPARGLALTDLAADAPEAPRTSIGLAELDRVLGGGLTEASATLVGGDPGVGKSTLLLQAAARLAAKGETVLYVSGEEAVGQIRMRARRLGLENTPVKLAAATNLREILATLETERPALTVIDSIQTMWLDAIESAPGSVSQVRACAHELTAFAKRRGCAVIIIGHVTKEGQIAGPRVMEHMVDTVLYFEGERSHQFRILRAVKNRFGAADEIGVFEMTGAGLSEAVNPSALFLGERGAPASGSAVFAGMEGTRPVLVEIQALVAPAPYGSPRRAVVGLDQSRLAMILAVLEARAGVGLGGRDVYLNAAGGFRVSEPASDLAVAAALLSAHFDVPLPADAVIFGEIGLSGGVRAVAQTEARLREAAKLGFQSAWLAEPPGQGRTAPSRLEMDAPAPRSGPETAPPADGEVKNAAGSAMAATASPARAGELDAWRLAAAAELAAWFLDRAGPADEAVEAD